MTLNELIERLDDIRQELGDDIDPEIQLATQQNYPLRYHLAGVATFDDIADVEEKECPNHEGYLLGHPGCDYEPEEKEAQEPIVWLVEGSQHYQDPYGVPSDAWAAAR